MTQAAQRAKPTRLSQLIPSLGLIKPESGEAGLSGWRPYVGAIRSAALARECETARRPHSSEGVTRTARVSAR